MSESIPIKKYFIQNEDEEFHEADEPTEFHTTAKLLQQLRQNNPDVVHTMFAEIDI